MTVYLKLFLTFLKIGAVSFGGGYGMISLIRETVIQNGWLTDGELLNFIAVSESTPGPIAINMATFIGSSQGGIFGSFCATLGVVLPSFVIILIIVALVSNLLKIAGVKAFLGGIRPCVMSLIIGTAITMGLSTLLGLKTVSNEIDVNIKSIIILGIIIVIHFVVKYLLKKKIKPIIMIIISAFLGVAVYSI